MMQLEIYDASGYQYRPAFRNLRFAKTFFGGEDVWLSFDLDRDIAQDHPDIGYGNDVILRKGLTPVWRGEMRQIEQREDSITINCLGLWVKLDDASYGDRGKLWCDSRLAKWRPSGKNQPWGSFLYTPHKYQMSQSGGLFIAPRKNERFTDGMSIGAMLYEGIGIMSQIATDPNPLTIKRVSFDYKVDLAWTTNFRFRLWSHSTVAVTNEWDPGAGALRSGVVDRVLWNPAGGAFLLVFEMDCTSAGWTTYTGETEEHVYAEISNLRVWGEVTESPSMIHVTEDIIGKIGV